MEMFDELNILSIEEYFEGMELSSEEKRKRIKFSESMIEVMLFIFALFSTMQEYEYMNKQYISAQLQTRYIELVRKSGVDIDFDVSEYIKQFSQDVVETTLKYPDEEFYLSDERAVLVSVNEANSILGYRQFQEAKEKGYTRKTWITEKDNKVRKTHREVDELIIPIDDYFLVGDSLMMYPHDFNAEVKETANCRCSIDYS